MFKHRVRGVTRKAILSGVLVRRPCALCAAAEVEPPHRDYGRPLDVVWLCRPHHLAVHSKAGAHLLDGVPVGAGPAQPQRSTEAA